MSLTRTLQLASPIGYYDTESIDLPNDPGISFANEILETCLFWSRIGIVVRRSRTISCYVTRIGENFNPYLVITFSWNLVFLFLEYTFSSNLSNLLGTFCILEMPLSWLVSLQLLLHVLKYRFGLLDDR